jgi:hypothetical protein
MYGGKAANASVVFTLEQVGPDVIATGTGMINTVGLTLVGSFSAPDQVAPAFGALLIGQGAAYDAYVGMTGPSGFGPGSQTTASSATGDYVGFQEIGGGFVLVPIGYVSGDPISGNATFSSTTLSALGVTTGTYTWTWGTGSTLDSLTLYAGVPAPTAVPEPASLALLALGLMGTAMPYARKKLRG